MKFRNAACPLSDVYIYSHQLHHRSTIQLNEDVNTNFHFSESNIGPGKAVKIEPSLQWRAQWPPISQSRFSVNLVSSYGLFLFRKFCSSQASPLRKVKITSKVPRKLPRLAARRPEGVIEKVMPSASNVEKVGIPLPKVKEKVEKRGKYLRAVVDSLVALGQGGKGRSCAGIISRMQNDFPDFPWDNKPVIKKHMGLALKVGVEEGVLVQQVTCFATLGRFQP